MSNPARTEQSSSNPSLGKAVAAAGRVTPLLAPFHGTFWLCWRLGRTQAARRSGEEALKRSEQRLRLALQGGNLGLWNRDWTTQELVVNERWLMMLAWPLDRR